MENNDIKSNTHTIKCPCGELYIIINTDNKFHSVIINNNFSRKEPRGDSWFSAMRGIIKQLKHPACNQTTVAGKSCVDCIGKIIEQHFKEEEK